MARRNRSSRTRTARCPIQDLIRASFALGRKIAAMTAPGERRRHAAVRSGLVVTFFALHAFGRTPTMLNFTARAAEPAAACKLAGVKRVLTSHRFIEQAKLHDIVDALERPGEITYLEDVRGTIGFGRQAVRRRRWLLPTSVPSAAPSRPTPAWCCSPPAASAPRAAWS
jgi:acyl-[acyl-carrier-protein]-phospholipid O-acyltransferase/long-chain-fatty-acid--[acyl-carrier-protein] ligase